MDIDRLQPSRAKVLKSMRHTLWPKDDVARFGIDHGVAHEKPSTAL
jgi:hypothetical protein